MSSLATSSVSETPLRSLGAWEELYWRYASTVSGVSGFALAMEVEGPTSVEQWRRALDRVQRSQPLFSVIIEDVPGGRPVFRSVADAPIPMRTRSIEGARWEDEAAREVGEAFRGDERPPLRSVLLHDPDRAILVLACHHAISDGASLAAAMLDLFRALHGEEIVGHPVPASIEDELDVSAPPPGGMPPLPPLAGPPMELRRDAPLPTVTSLILSEARTTAIRDGARRNGTTVQGVLGVAVASVRRRVNPGWGARSVQLMSSIDPRRHLGLAEGSALYAQSITTSLDADDAARFWDEARYLSRALRSAVGRDTAVLVATALAAAVAPSIDDEGGVAFLGGAFSCDLGLTNVGAIEAPRSAGGLTLTSFWGPSVLIGIVGEQTVGAATIGGRLHLTHTTREPIPNLLDAAIQVLEARL